MTEIDLNAAEWSWSRETEANVDAKGSEASWRCSPQSDYWRKTLSGVVIHNGHACTVNTADDFTIEGEFSADLSTQYDQVGFIVIRDEETWFKCGFEREGRLWVGGVHTKDFSDWSLQPADSLGALRVSRAEGTLEVHRRAADGEWLMMRQLTLEGGVSVGYFSAAPVGEGFRSSLSEFQLTLGNS